MKYLSYNVNSLALKKCLGCSICYQFSVPSLIQSVDLNDIMSQPHCNNRTCSYNLFSLGNLVSYFHQK